MQTRSPRTILAVSAAVAFSAAALLPAATLARGPGAGDGSCDRDCSADQASAQLQVRARDGSGSGAAPRTQARARSQDQASQGSLASDQRQAGNRVRAANPIRADKQYGPNRGAGAGNSAAPRQLGPEACETCEQLEMGELSDEQTAQLIFMANEEKLAHDVYLALAELYDVSIFSNIAEAEAQHQSAVDTILDRYEIDDDTSALAPGEFTDPGIATLYGELMEQGSLDLDEAIAVGVFIESDDISALGKVIADLEEDAPDVANMYAHLLAGSQRHLEAFSRAS